MDASQKPEQHVMDRLVGAWTLVSWLEITSNGEEVYPLGRNAVGQIIYSADGHLAAQLVRRERERFVSEDWRDASVGESSRAWKEYFGYFGTYSIDLDLGAVVHHVQGSWFPNLFGTDQIRRFRFEGSNLFLEANTEWGEVRIVWERALDTAHTRIK